MEIKKFRIIIVLIAAIIVCIMGIIYQYSLIRLSLSLVVVVIIFYFFGSILQKLYNRAIKKEENKENPSDSLIEDIVKEDQ